MLKDTKESALKALGEGEEYTQLPIKTGPIELDDADLDGVVGGASCVGSAASAVSLDCIDGCICNV